MRQPKNRRAIIAISAVVVVSVGAARTRRAYDASRPTHLLTPQQVAARAQPICRLLSPEAESLLQTTETLTRVDAGGHKHTTYAVDCENEAGQHLIHTVWDAETGHLLMAARHVEPRGGGEGKPSVAVPPAQCAWHWLERLGVANLAPRWQVSRPPALERNNWKVILKSDQDCATVVLDRNTANLVYFTLQSADHATHQR